ncbi:GNAT family N-acetyltransferase [Aeromicrobium wangtongii]|uniref:GNAT family N-acetyltransferase n=1 Tax=Aeromicrobium wangtongii TaxID=2969247 RepID=UPI0020178A0D|nr:GNAT family N-acetyltransferase [Aeromicrobium wangtongii]MCL3818890.1 GNAT family N-acetyltransferase [Aeromicrobium wangtongii]
MSSAMNADVSARLAWPDDAAAIVRVQLASWRRGFADVLPAAELDAIDPDELARRWATTISAPQDARMRVLVALERADIRGFALVHPSYDPDADQVRDGEVGEFVVDGEHQRAGHGSRLLQAAMDTLAADRFTRAVWWIGSTDDVLRGFVTESGWEADGAHRELATADGATVKQVRLHTSLA